MECAETLTDSDEWWRRVAPNHVMPKLFGGCGQVQMRVTAGINEQPHAPLGQGATQQRVTKPSLARPAVPGQHNDGLAPAPPGVQVPGKIRSHVFGQIPTPKAYFAV